MDSESPVLQWKGRIYTSEFRLLVSVPTLPWRSISTVDTPSLSWSFRAIAKPTTPPPITAWVKSALRTLLVEKDWWERARAQCTERADMAENQVNWMEYGITKWPIGEVGNMELQRGAHRWDRGCLWLGMDGGLRLGAWRPIGVNS